MNILLAKGSRGSEVKKLQTKLNEILSIDLTIDGIFGYSTDLAVRNYQRINNLKIDGIIGNITWNSLFPQSFNPLASLGSNRFVVFVDAGHSGVDSSGNYLTPGKRAYHPDLTLHGNGYYYEGYENRLVAESFIEKCTAAGIQTIRTYHPYKDTPLSDRVELIKSYLDRGYYGYLHSFHSNAISYKNSKDKLENTIGFMCFTTTKNNHSDIIAWEHIRNVRNKFPDWHYFGGDDPKGDNDIEKDFYIISKSELSTQPKYGAILEEFGFHTSSKDCQFIVDNRESRALAALKTAIYAQIYFNKI